MNVGDDRVAKTTINHVVVVDVLSERGSPASTPAGNTRNTRNTDDVVHRQPRAPATSSGNSQQHQHLASNSEGVWRTWPSIGRIVMKIVGVGSGITKRENRGD
ncbi:hypothetical protein PM082_004795 [Marasmius tenuissimus]|nr:hypothetical protein PM082_002526 [Marasmius tenuissimus]KAJ8085976.1 hypothetical protein PM082_004795 [Marasmius tenuissimus]